MILRKVNFFSEKLKFLQKIIIKQVLNEILVLKDRASNVILVNLTNLSNFTYFS